MAIPLTSSLLPLDRWAQIMGISLPHFNNLDDGQPTSATHPYWTEADHYDLSQYIRQAESMLADQLGYAVAPTDRISRMLFMPPPAIPWTKARIKLPTGHLQAFGRWEYTAVQEGATVTYDGDKATITVTTDSTDLAVYYTRADGGLPKIEESRIRPLTVTLDDGTATIQGHKAQFVKPSVLVGNPASYSEAASFVTSVDVYKIVVDSSEPLILEWDGLDVDSTSAPDEPYTMTGTARVDQFTYAYFNPRPATWNGSEHVTEQPITARPPSHITAEYIAGYPLSPDGNIDPQLERAVVRLANVLMPETMHWLNDFAQTRWTHDREQPDTFLQDQLENPFGLSNGALYAWAVVKRMRLARMPI